MTLSLGLYGVLLSPAAELTRDGKDSFEFLQPSGTISTMGRILEPKACTPRIVP